MNLQISGRLCGFWEAVKNKKKQLDDWNPTVNHPSVKSIHKSKMAGMKETIKSISYNKSSRGNCNGILLHNYIDNKLTLTQKGL